MTDAEHLDLADSYTGLTADQLRADVSLVGPRLRHELMSAFGEIGPIWGPRRAMDVFREVEAAGADLPQLLRSADGRPTAESAFFSALHDLAEAGSVEVDERAVVRLALSTHPDVGRAAMRDCRRALRANDHEYPFAVSVFANQHVAHVAELVDMGVELGNVGESRSVRAVVDLAVLTRIHNRHERAMADLLSRASSAGRMTLATGVFAPGLGNASVQDDTVDAPSLAPDVAKRALKAANDRIHRPPLPDPAAVTGPCTVRGAQRPRGRARP